MLYISNFIDHLTHERRFSDHTVTAYKNDLEQFCQYLDLEKDSDLLEVNHRLMRTYLVELVESGLENSSVNRKLSSVKSLFKTSRGCFNQSGHQNTGTQTKKSFTAIRS